MANHPDVRDTLNAMQAAEMLFADIETIQLLARSGELPGAKVGKSWVFLRDDVIEFLRGRVRIETSQRKQAALPTAVLMPRPSRRRRPPPVLPALPAKQDPAASKPALPTETTRPRLTDEFIE